MLHRTTTTIDPRSNVARGIVALLLAAILAIAVFALQSQSTDTVGNTRTVVQSSANVNSLERPAAFWEVNVDLMPQGIYRPAASAPAAFVPGLGTGFWEANTNGLPQIAGERARSNSADDQLRVNPRFWEANVERTR